MPDLKVTVFELSDSDVRIIEAFTELFYVDSDSKNLHFLNHNQPKLKYDLYDKINIVNESECALKKEQHSLEQCNNRQIELNDALKKYDSGNTDSIEKCKLSLKEALEEKKIISSAETNEESLEQVKRQLFELQEKTSDLEIKREAMDEHHNNAQTSLDKANREREKAYEMGNQIKKMRNIFFHI